MVESSPTAWSEWWEWELAFTPHVETRMEERGFWEVDVRRMLQDAREFLPARHPGRWIVRTQHAGGPWHVVVEPDPDQKLLVVVTAFPQENPP